MSPSGPEPHLSFMTAFCPPIGLAEPCKTFAVVSPPPSCLYIFTSSANKTSRILTSAVTAWAPSFMDDAAE